MSGRFDCVKYDSASILLQERAKSLCELIEELIEQDIGPCRESSIAVTQLEHLYARIGRAIRDKQIERYGTTKE